MKKKLIDQKYLLIPNFISLNEVNQYVDEFLYYDKNYQLESIADYAPNCSDAYNPLFAAEVLCNMTSRISDIVGECVVPTYSYGRIYRNGDVLPKHTDRAACEISLTIHLRGDAQWFFGCYDKKFLLNPGDAILYLGTLVPHYRVGPFSGKEYMQFFLHYVRSRGCHSDCIFDKIETNVDNKKLLEEINGI